MRTHGIHAYIRLVLLHVHLDGVHTYVGVPLHCAIYGPSIVLATWLAKHHMQNLLEFG